MNVANNIKMDLTKPDLTVSVHAVQGDAYTRTLQIALYCGLQPWTVPEDATVAVRYAKPDHTKGLYAALPDGTCAWSVQENILTVALAPQMLTVPGNVKVQIILSCGDQVLSTFGLIVHVEANPAIGVLHSENYFNWPQWIRSQAAEQVALARQASESAADFLEETKSIAEHVSAIVAGNEAYTKEETDQRFAPAVIQKAAGSNIQLSDSQSFRLQGLTFFGSTLLDGTPSPSVPAGLVNVGMDGSIGILISGKNLFDPALLSIEPGYNTYDAETGLWTTNAQSSWVRSFFQNVVGSNTQRDVNKLIPVPENTPVTVQLLDLVNNTGITDTFQVWQKDSQGLDTASVTTVTTNKATLTTVPGTRYLDISRANNSGTLSFSGIQVEIGSAATDYECYKEPQTMTVSTPNGLPGIPAASGGNYTDENGQQWVCDEIDFARGVYVQRVGSIASYSGESVGAVYLSSTGELSTGATVIYPIDTPIETALSDGEIAAYSALHTYYPNTTITNDAGAGMEVEYTTDTKLYIDRKFTELAAAIV